MYITHSNFQFHHESVYRGSLYIYMWCERVSHTFIIYTISSVACDRTCERCYSEPDMCTRCIACLNPSYEVCESASSTAKVCREECNPNQEPNSNLYNTCGGCEMHSDI